MNMISVVTLGDKIRKVHGKPWSPIEIARSNDHVLRLAFIDGKYHWHVHKSEDEIFCVIKGKITIRIKDNPDITLNEGQVAVMPKGIEHCPESLEPSYVLLFQPIVLNIKGD